MSAKMLCEILGPDLRGMLALARGTHPARLPPAQPRGHVSGAALADLGSLPEVTAPRSLLSGPLSVVKSMRDLLSDECTVSDNTAEFLVKFSGSYLPPRIHS